MTQQVRVVPIMMYLFLCIVPGTAYSAESGACVWSDFVQSPIAENHSKCKKQVQKSLSPTRQRNVHSEIVNTQTQVELIAIHRLYASFLALISQGNKYALDLGFEMRQLTDGGARHDLDISLGRNIRRDPRLFLTLMRQYEITKQSDWESVVLSLGDDCVDDFTRQMQEIVERMESLESVNEPEFKYERQLAIQPLENRKTTLLKIKQSQ